ncbi:hypothetical protein ABZY06_28865 [Streptomyces sp. NPDC006540]|jgi:hypothetical protein|uniref:hypothetical protein n=1 Tax=Streptomyces sp. NPDC006540 TaxID=3155353 RepID=UPI0033A0FDAA
MTSLTRQEEKLLNSFEEVRRCDRIEVHADSLGSLGKPFTAMPAPDEFAPELAGVEYDADLSEHMVRFETFASHWSTRSPLPEFSGEFSLSHLFDVFSQPPNPWASMEPTEFRKEFVGSLKCIDSSPISGSGRMSFLRAQPHTNPWEIWYQGMAGTGGEPYPPGYVKLEISYSQYIETLAITKGTSGWQYLFADISLSDSSWRHAREPLQAMLDVFPELFPEYDYAPLRARLEARL